MSNEHLLEKNISSLKSLNQRFADDSYLAPIIKKAKAKSQAADISIDEWLRSDDKIVVLPQLIPRSEAVYHNFKRSANERNIKNEGIASYLDIHNDIHLADAACSLYDLAVESGIDVTEGTSTLNPGCVMNFVCFGTGNGKTLSTIIDSVKPYRILILISDWSDIVSSFWTVDWPALSEKYNKKPNRLEIIKVKSEQEVLQHFSSFSLVGMDHSLVYIAPQAESEVKSYARILRTKKVSNLIDYLGYVVDEYNMIANSADSLCREPLIMTLPSAPLDIACVVCGSGPSLDSSLDAIKQLSETHLIIAGGSSIKSLLKAGIRVDYLTLMERDDGVFHDYLQLSKEYDLSTIKLIMSVTCSHELLDIFPNSAIFFRPALTPLSVFSDYPREILQLEGPESVNTAMALAAQLGSRQIVMAGVDLGSISPANTRSVNAAGATERILDIATKGNLSEVAYTNKALVDVRYSIESLASVYNSITNIYNISDGVEIEGCKPMHSVDVCNLVPPKDLDSLKKSDNWWNQLSRYTHKRLSASFEIRRPRQSTYNMMQKLRTLFLSDQAWFPFAVLEVDSILDLRVPLQNQFPIRIARSVIYRAVIMVSQQFQILYYKDRNAMSEYGSNARQYLASLCDRLESEIYELCDYVDSVIGK